MACKPVFNVVMVPVRIYDKVAGTLIGILMWPFKALAAAFQKPA